MKIYVAGRVKQMEIVRATQHILIAAGHTISFDWTGEEGEQKEDWSGHHGRARELSMAERAGVLAADAVVLVGHGCEEGGGGLGCFIEVGMAMARERRVVVYGPARESVFWYLPEVVRVDNHSELLEALENPSDGVCSNCGLLTKPHQCGNCGMEASPEEFKKDGECFNCGARLCPVCGLAEMPEYLKDSNIKPGYRVPAGGQQ